MLFFLIGLCLLTTLLAGLYPAFVLAGFSPSEALRSRFNLRRSRASLSLRRGLVTFQFVVAQQFYCRGHHRGWQHAVFTRKTTGIPAKQRAGYPFACEQLRTNHSA